MTQMPMPLSWASASLMPKHLQGCLLSGTRQQGRFSQAQGSYTANVDASSHTSWLMPSTATLTPP